MSDIRRFIPVALVALLAAVVLSAAPSSDADIDSYHGTIDLTEDMYIADDTTVNILPGTVFNLHGYTLHIGSDCLVFITGHVTFNGTDGSVVIGSGTDLTFPDGTFPVPEELSVNLNGSLEIDHDGLVIPDVVSLVYTPADSGLMTVSFTRGDTSYEITSGRLSLRYEYTIAAQKVVEDYLRDSTKTFEDLVDAMGVLTIGVKADFDRVGIAQSVTEVGGVSESAVILKTAHEGVDVELTLSGLGIIFEKFNVDTFMTLEKPSGSDATHEFTLSSPVAPHLEIRKDGTLSLVTSAGRVAFTNVCGSEVYGVAFENAEVSVNLSLKDLERITDLLDTLSNLVGSLTVSAGVAEVFTDKSSFEVRDASVSALFEGLTFSEFNLAATVYGERFSLSAKGFEITTTERADGNIDAALTIDTVTLALSDITLILDTVVGSVIDLDVSTVIEKISARGSLALQDLVDYSRGVILSADKVTIESETTAVMNGVTAGLSKDVDNMNFISLEFGSAEGTISSSLEVLDVTMSPTIVTIASDCPLDYVFSALFEKFEFTADSKATVTLETRMISLIDTVKTSEGVKSDTKFTLKPTSGSATLVFSLSYTASDRVLSVFSDVDLAGSTLTVYNSIYVEGADDLAVFNLSAVNVKGTLGAKVSSADGDSTFTVSADLRTDSNIRLYYFGISANIFTSNGEFVVDPLVFTVRGYDCAEHGVLPVVSALPSHDFKVAFDGKVSADKASLRTDTQTLSDYTDAKITLKEITMDMKRANHFTMVLGDVSIYAKGPDGSEYSKAIHHFVFNKDLTKPITIDESYVTALAIAACTGVVVVWCGIFITLHHNRFLAGGRRLLAQRKK